MRSPWCTRSVGSGGVNNMRIARIIMRRFSGGPGFVVPHGVIAPHGLDVASRLVGVVVHDVGIVDRRQLVGFDVDRLRDRGRFASRAARASPSESARCGLGPFTVHVENAWCVIELGVRLRARCGPRRRSDRDASA